MPFGHRRLLLILYKSFLNYVTPGSLFFNKGEPRLSKGSGDLIRSWSIGFSLTTLLESLYNAFYSYVDGRLYPKGIDNKI